MNLLYINIFLLLLEGLILPKKGYGKKLFLFIAFFQCFILHAFIDPFSVNDLDGYYMTFTSFAKNTLKESILVGYVGVKMEPGWIVLCKSLSYLSSNPRILLVFTSIIIVGSYFRTAYKYSSIVWLSLYIFLCSTFDQSLFVLRQHSAMALCLLSIPFIINRDLVKYILLLAVAVSFHSTALVFLPIYFVYNISLGKKYWIWMIVGAIVGSYLISGLFEWGFHNLWYSSYEDTTAEGMAASNLTGFFIILSALLLYIFSIGGDVKNIKGAEKVFFLMLSIGALLSLVGAGFSPTNRLLRYFEIAYIYLIPNSIMKFRNSFIRDIIILGVMVMYLMLFMSPSNLLYIGRYRLDF